MIDVRRPTNLALIATGLVAILLTGCAHSPVPRAYAPAVYGSAALGATAALGGFGSIDGAARSVMDAPFGDRVTRPETWLQHATVPVTACAFAMLLAWDTDACAPAAAGAAVFFIVKEAKEWGHPHFSPTDGIMDAAMPLLTGAMAVRIAGWPAWSREPR